GELLNKNHILSLSLAGCGLLELWEWRQIEPLINPANKDTLIPFAQFVRTVDYARRVVEWGSGMVRTVYDPVIHLFDKFEPLASGFFDDRIRSSLLLAQGEVASRLSEILASQVGMTHQVMGVKNQGEIRGINPGYASGELVVISGDPEKIVFSAQKIYLVRRAPADMKPVAGIATVSEGNLVSHVQLLARNLGIPNAVISEQNLNDLLPYAGKKVFYAVSPAGTVVLKTEAEMSPQEKALVEERKRSEERINVPTAKLNLNVETLVDLKNVRATDSGSLCGPKAANLGELKHLFPDKVVDGVVIPFGIFRRHLDQTMPGTASSYWLFLHNIFDNTSKMRDDGKTEGEIEKYALGKLAELSKAIRSMPFLDGFEENLADQFSAIFSEEIGEIPVFIRSDTNMEDLKDFTGAGLNLTVFNVREGDKIFQAIRDVWASPYAERSYRWRQKYLLNPENVFPSVLIIPTVPVEKSGVLITTGITSGESEDLTVAFNRGAAGAVEGQMAESYLLRQNGKDRLISPSRERWYTTLPQAGGILKKFTHFNKKILNSDDLKQIRAFARELQTKIADISKGQVHGPYDVELGFMDNDIWLFQVRPYVESKKARSSEYLRSLDQVQINPAHIRLNDKL
ncbi:MAG: phosphoenolpyruvate synthase, partial [Calditrichales bacterium]